MDKTIVIVAEGKGREGADFITPKIFDTVKEAEKYIESVNDSESKHWTRAEIVDNGERVEPWFDGFI